MAGIRGKYIYEDGYESYVPAEGHGQIVGATGSVKAKLTVLSRYGSDFFKRIGAKGGASGNTGGFAANRELARIAGAKGGRISKRGPSRRKDVDTAEL